MGRLKDFTGYLEERMRLLQKAEERLCALQAKYESFFGEVSKVREAEIEQLIAHSLRDRKALPDWFNQALDRAQAEVEQELAAKVAALEAERDRLLKEAEELRQGSQAAEEAVRQKNAVLDRQEEQLKERNAKLLASIGDYNRRIQELGHGFGFFANFFSMRSLAAQRRRLDTEQADVAANIEALRAKWVDADAKHAEKERFRKARWLELSGSAAALGAKLEALQAEREKLLVRSTVERALGELEREASGDDGGSLCPRCSTRNPATNHFCHICAQRLVADRPDFAGSIEEVSELNRHYQQFGDGMRACQEIIGLVRGLMSGIDAFSKSVADVQESEKKYPLPKLKIDVPKASQDYGRRFDELAAAVQEDQSLHPKAFADTIQAMVTNVLTEEKIKAYFETMGEELSRQAKAQW